MESLESSDLPPSNELSILVLTSSFPRSDGDYPGSFIQKSSEALTSRGMRVHVLCPADNVFSDYTPPGVSVTRFNYFFPKKYQMLAYRGGMTFNINNSKLAFLQLPFFLLSFLFQALGLSLHVNLLHANWLFPAGLVGVVCRILTRKPLIITIRGSDVNLAEGTMKKYFLRSIAYKADAIICVSKELKHKLLLWGLPPDFIRSFPDGVDLPNESFSRDHNSIIFIGRLAPEKRVEDLIEATEILSKNHIFHLKIAGDGPLKEKLFEQVTRIDGCVDTDFLGRIPRKEVPNLLSRSTIFVLPSTSEGLPDTLLIAMACGTPILGTRIPGIQQVIEEESTGLLVNPRSPRELARILEYMIEKPCLSKRLGLRAQRVAKHKYSRPKLNEKLISIYRQNICI